MLPPTRILIVEDDGILAENLKSFLARRSPDVRIAADSHSTMKILETFTPDVVVLDFGLPGMDGLQTYAVIVRRQAPQASCIMISGHLTEDLTRTANDQGIHHVLCKPFSLAELQEMIDQSLGKAVNAADKVTLDEDRRVTTNHRREERRILPDRRHFDVLSGQRE
ncbi:MAG: response regulator [Methylotenera sp.]